MAAIRTATPPEMTFEGQLQRMRDRNQAAAEDEEPPLDETRVTDDEEDDMLDLEDLAPEPAPVPVRRALVARASKPGHRQAPAPTVAPAPSWWLQHPTREGFTSAGEKATEQSRHRKEAAGIGLGSLAKE